MDKLRTARGGVAATLALLFVLAVAGSSLAAGKSDIPAVRAATLKYKDLECRHRRRLRPVLRVHRAAGRRHDGPALPERDARSAIRRWIRSVPRCSCTSRRAPAATAWSPSST